ncbi:polysaccharide deacetylase family sporulation protein PdaB [Alicyclobacillus cellulosilyticus]|uniref:Polysaccharide deacetylase family sporulation protein PdaB n=1 Tax=Alicyclobacillus cellulosilyticus TaxID=1003997 RepID=A0A917K6I7_9BACL|nr:polysaccharide deacetylase family sporulation protein PdaB [Alicyclobacillus cellulosilyticus]GGJ00787.1 polysaccharide deacetylase family sporulation protein PdaB [Alicyclobacillus cellulosilyticus]
MKDGKKIVTLTAIVALFMAVLFTASGEWRAFAAEDKPAAIYKVDTDQKVVALTFDISWGNKVPEPVLDVLQKENVKKATFFLSGPWTLRHAEIAQRIRDMGFEIGSHGHLHKDYSNYPDSWIRSQVAEAEKAIHQVTGVRTRLIRTPNGDLNPRVIRCLHSMGYTVIQWHTDSLDWKNPGVDQIVQRVLTRVVPGDIILMHASDSSKQIVAALPRIIHGLRAKGYQFATVSELLTLARVETKVE